MSLFSIHISTNLCHEVRDRDGHIVAIFGSDHCAQIFLAAYEAGLSPAQIKKLPAEAKLQARIKELEEQAETLVGEIQMLQASCEEHIRIRNELGDDLDELQKLNSGLETEAHILREVHKKHLAQRNELKQIIQKVMSITE